MKKIKFAFVISIAGLVFFACQKEPTANFMTDKTTYTAGETIHCINLSAYAHSWKWTAPDGKIYTTPGFDYAIDSNELSGTRTFTLEVASKNGKKSNQISKSMSVRQYINPSNYFSLDNTSRQPDSIVCGVTGSYWVIRAAQHGEISLSAGSGYGTPDFIEIYFSDDQQPATGTYLLQSDTSFLAFGKACIILTHYRYTEIGDSWRKYKSDSGEVVISNKGSGRFNAVFSNVHASYLGSHYISGEITFH